MTKINIHQNVGLNRDIIHDLSSFKFSSKYPNNMYVCHCHVTLCSISVNGLIDLFLLQCDNYPITSH